MALTNYQFIAKPIIEILGTNSLYFEEEKD